MARWCWCGSVGPTCWLRSDGFGKFFQEPQTDLRRRKYRKMKAACRNQMNKAFAEDLLIRVQDQEEVIHQVTDRREAEDRMIDRLAAEGHHEGRGRPADRRDTRVVEGVHGHKDTLEEADRAAGLMKEVLPPAHGGKFAAAAPAAAADDDGMDM